MNEFQIQSINSVTEMSKCLLYHGVVATGAIKDAYYFIINSNNEAHIENEVLCFKKFVEESNRQALRRN